ncbi:hypothetical protein [Agromyces bauzanensis]|uniref:Uncharacterized protein n=1 Tax=Agromyces bauzanensis TaxID=1308924 RepID=A0A917UVJ5_9MICO|nr:hypothetical protein GCM10011372_28010 [Agromyces bauzanensis]
MTPTGGPFEATAPRARDEVAEARRLDGELEHGLGHDVGHRAARLRERPRPDEQVANDEQRPSIPDPLEGPSEPLYWPKPRAARVAMDRARSGRQ